MAATRNSKAVPQNAPKAPLSDDRVSLIVAWANDIDVDADAIEGLCSMALEADEREASKLCWGIQALTQRVQWWAWCIVTTAQGRDPYGKSNPDSSFGVICDGRIERDLVERIRGEEVAHG